MFLQLSKALCYLAQKRRILPFIRETLVLGWYVYMPIDPGGIVTEINHIQTSLVFTFRKECH